MLTIAPPVALRLHAARRFLRDEEDPLEIGVDDPVPILLRQIEEGARGGDAGIVDEDVERAERRHGLGHGRLDRSPLRDVEPDRHGGAAALADLLADARGEIDPAGRGRDPRPGARQDRGEVASETARGARHQRRFTGKIEEERCGGRGLHGRQDDTSLRCRQGTCQVGAEDRLPITPRDLLG